jgi:hypothetical protein
VLTVAAYSGADEEAWEELVAAAPMGTLLHTRRFLGYHGDRFEDASLVLRDDDGRAAGLLPAAVDPDDSSRVASHPGVTFGGVVHDGALAGERMIEALSVAARHLRERGFERLGYAAVPWIYQRRPSGDDLYALFRLGASRARCDLSCAIDLEEGRRPSSRRRRGLARARRSGVEVAWGADRLDELWPVVEANLASRHGARPVHSVAEMGLLAELFPDEIAVALARLDGDPVAGVVLFHSARVVHAQYIASTEAGNDAAALDLVFHECIERARARGARFFDFGTSNREGGRVLNEGLYEFKRGFGGGGVAYERYELDLRSSAGTP